MNYRHAFHAGGFADVLKHAILALTVEHLKRKDTPFFALDTHAGRGRYDLAGDEAGRTGEHLAGIARLLDDPAPPDPLTPYLDVVRRLQQDSESSPLTRWYPGSPLIVRELLRRGDRLFAVELHPEDHAALAEELAGDRQVRTYALDGFTALRAFLPPKERRGLVLIDPAFEVTDEFERVLRALAEGLRRWSTGCFLIWYPIKYTEDVASFRRRAAELAAPRGVLDARLLVRPAAGEKLAGCGVLVVNPPFPLAAQLAELLPYLAGRLGQTPAASAEAVWLVEPP